MDPLLLLLLGMAIVVGGIAWLRLHAFVALISAAIVVGTLTPRSAIEDQARAQGMSTEAAAGRADEGLGTRLASKFGSTAAQLGLLIAMASIVGVCLMESGGAERLVRSMLAVFGENRAPLVFAISGFVLCVPIFFDTVFLLLIPLGRAMALRTGRNYVLYVLSILAGAVMTHSLVPPTPGPLFVASALNVDVGVMIIGGIVIGAITTAAGLGYAFHANRKWPWAMDASVTGDAAFTERPASALPSLGAALLPIATAVGLIAGHAIARAIDPDSGLTRALGAIGHPNIALAVSAAIALLLLARTQRGKRGAVLQGVQRALTDAGMIILITAAGGVFGGMLQDTGIGPRIGGLARDFQLAILPLAFAVTALVRTAQGSATVAMITAVGMFSGFADAGTLGCHPVYLALAIGCGSKLVPWMNDSGFWVVCRLSGFSEVQMLRTFSAALTLMGTVGLIAILVLSWFLPLV